MLTRPGPSAVSWVQSTLKPKSMRSSLPAALPRPASITVARSHSSVSSRFHWKSGPSPCTVSSLNTGSMSWWRRLATIGTISTRLSSPTMARPGVTSRYSDTAGQSRPAARVKVCTTSSGSMVILLPGM